MVNTSFPPQWPDHSFGDELLDDPVAGIQHKQIHTLLGNFIKSIIIRIMQLYWMIIKIPELFKNLGRVISSPNFPSEFPSHTWHWSSRERSERTVATDSNLSGIELINLPAMILTPQDDKVHDKSPNIVRQKSIWGTGPRKPSFVKCRALSVYVCVHPELIDTSACSYVQLFSKIIRSATCIMLTRRRTTSGHESLV